MLRMEVTRSHRQFVLHHCLGRGGYGEVYRATMLSPGGLRADVAVKLLRVDVGVADDAVRRLKDEGRMLGMLRHPGILRVFDLAVLDGRVGLVTEYVEGQDLTALVGSGSTPGVLPARCLVEIAAVVADVLEVAWSHPAGPDGEPMRLVHRDIKPSNLRVGRHGEVKVLDFGIARSTTEQVDREARTGTGSTVGSLAYMAPERFTRAPAAPAADVFGLGCVVYEGLAGRRYFVDPVPVDMFKLAADPHAYATHLELAFAELPPGIHPELLALVRRMLAHAASERPTASEVRDACDALASRLPGPTLRNWAREREWPKVLTVPGFLDGKTITEGTLSSTELLAFGVRDDRSSETFRLELPQRPVVAPDAVTVGRVEVSPGRRVWPIALLAVAAVALAAVYVLWPKPAPRPVPVPVPIPIAVPAPRPEPDPPAPVIAEVTEPPLVVPPVPVPVPEPAPAPEPPPRPAPRPRPAPVPAPVPVEPPVEPPEPVRVGRITVEPASVRVELRGPTGRFGAGEVPAGSGYELFADFGNGLHPIGTYVDVVPDHTLTLRCNTLRYTCDVDR